MAVIIGSARHDENNRYSGGQKGDSLQTTTPDYKGEVSMQNFYVHKKGWTVIRPIDTVLAEKIAEKMKAACNNKNIGYSQSDRYAIIKDGIDTKKLSNCDCSSLVRECVKEASGKDPGDFTTANAAMVLYKTGLFLAPFRYNTNVALQDGDILCTCIKGHIVAVTDSGNSVKSNPYHEPTEVIKMSSRGDGVRWVQSMLNKHGYNLVVDGEAGVKTISAVCDFQSCHGLKVDGQVGKLTRAELKKGG